MYEPEKLQKTLNLCAPLKWQTASLCPLKWQTAPGLLKDTAVSVPRHILPCKDGSKSFRRFESCVRAFLLSRRQVGSRRRPRAARGSKALSGLAAYVRTQEDVLDKIGVCGSKGQQGTERPCCCVYSLSWPPVGSYQALWRQRGSAQVGSRRESGTLWPVTSNK